MAKRKGSSPGGRGGAPSKLTPERQKTICTAMRLGLFGEQAAQLAGIDEKTLDRWLARGRKHLEVDGDVPAAEALYVDFVRAFERAKAEGETDYVRAIQNASETQWQAAAWILERRHPKRWGPKVRHIVEEEQAALLDRLRARLTPEEFARFLDAAAADGVDA